MIMRNQNQDDIKRHNKTGEIGEQFRLFYFSISPILVCNFAQFEITLTKIGHQNH